eukprot:1096-Heterococcus_DN1.PRE.1
MVTHKVNKNAAERKLDAVLKKTAAILFQQLASAQSCISSMRMQRSSFNETQLALSIAALAEEGYHPNMTSIKPEALQIFVAANLTGDLMVSSCDDILRRKPFDALASAAAGTMALKSAPFMLRSQSYNDAHPSAATCWPQQQEIPGMGQASADTLM